MSHTTAAAAGNVNNKIHDNANFNAVVLLIILDFLFITNQVSFCAFTIAQHLNFSAVLTYESTYEELRCWCITYWGNIITAFGTVVAEPLCHSANFILYFMFSRGFREEVYLCVKSILGFCKKMLP